MADTLVRALLPSGVTPALKLATLADPDTIVNGSGDVMAEGANLKGVYTATVSEALDGTYVASFEDGSTVLAAMFVRLQDDTAAYWCEDSRLTVNIHKQPGQVDMPLTPTIDEMIPYLYKSLRNGWRSGNNVAEILADDGTTVDHVAAVTESNGIVTRAKMLSGATPPLAAIVPDSPTTNATTMNFTITWNEQVSGFEFNVSDLQGINSVLANLVEVTPGLVYTISAITTLGVAGPYGVRVIADSCNSVATGLGCQQSEGTTDYTP